MGGGHRHAGARDPERGLDEPRPRQPAEARVQRSEPARKARDGARARPDRVVDELLAERHLQLHRRRARSRGHVDEAVEAPGVASRPSRSRAHRRAGRSSPSRRRTRRDRPQRPHPPRIRPPRGSRSPPPRSRGVRRRQRRATPLATLLRPRSRPDVSSFTPRGDSGDLDRRRPHGPHQGSQAGADREARPERDGHRLSRGPDRDAHAVGSTTSPSTCGRTRRTTTPGAGC